MSKAIEEFLKKLKNLEGNYEIYPYEKYDCEISFLHECLSKGESQTNEKLLSIWKDIFHKPYFELSHPLYNHIKTRAVKAVNMTSISQYLFFIDENNQHPWVCLNLYNQASSIITLEKIFILQRYMSDQFGGHNQWLRWKIITGLRNLELKKEDLQYKDIKFRFLIDGYERPLHYFQEILASIYKFSLFDCEYIRGVTFFTPKNISKDNFFENNEDFIEIFPIYSFPNFSYEKITNESLQDFTTLIPEEDRTYQADLTLWLGIPGERRVWIEQIEGIALILKNLIPYFPKIKVYVDGMTAYDGERIEVLANKEAFEAIKAKVDELRLDIKMKSLAGYDYRTKICYCSMCDIAISDVSSTALVPFVFCKKSGVAFCCSEKFGAYAWELDQYSKKIPHLKTSNIKHIRAIYYDKNPNFFNFHIPPEHLYNLAAESLEELKNIKMHRLDVPPVELYAKKYELEQKTQINFGIGKNTKALLKSIKNQKMLLEFDSLFLDKELKTLQINEIKLKNLQIKKLQEGYTKLVVRDDLPSAKQRIHNHLDYKLGQILIRNSKSFLGYIKMPYLLIALTLIHKEEQKAYKEKIKANPNLALPPLENYADYKEALKEKECFTYKLGEAFIKATRTWYKGGYLIFYFKELPRLKSEFKKSKNKV